MPGFALLLAPIFSVFGCANRLDPDETAWSGLQASRMPALPRSRRSDRRSISTASVSGSLEAGSGDSVIFVHGVVASLWMVLFVTQAMLVAAARTRLHRRLGIAGVALTAAMAAVGVWIGWSQPMAQVEQASIDPLAPIQVYPVSDDSP